MTYQVKFRDMALRELQKLPRPAFGQAISAIVGLATEPRPHGVKKLAGGEPALYRIRVGDYRIIYAIDDKERLVRVVRVAHRREAYS